MHADSADQGMRLIPLTVPTRWPVERTVGVLPDGTEVLCTAWVFDALDDGDDLDVDRVEAGMDGVVRIYLARR